jgi:hypothetical protein
MKKFLLPINIFVLFLFVSGIVFAAVSLQYFTARNNAEGILIEWKTLDEDGTAKFDIERSANTPDNFIYIGTKNATGNNSYYSYQDNSVEIGGGNNPANSIYYYRLKCVQPGGGNYSYTNHITVSHSVSGIRSTWGSIKAIFR